MRKITFIAMMLGISFVAFSCKAGNKPDEVNAPGEVSVYQIVYVLSNGSFLVGQ